MEEDLLSPCRFELQTNERTMGAEAVGQFQKRSSHNSHPRPNCGVTALSLLNNRLVSSPTYQHAPPGPLPWPCFPFSPCFSSVVSYFLCLLFAHPCASESYRSKTDQKRCLCAVRRKVGRTMSCIRLPLDMPAGREEKRNHMITPNRRRSRSFLTHN